MKEVKLFIMGVAFGICFLSPAQPDISSTLFNIENDLEDIKNKIFDLSQSDEKEFSIKNLSSQNVIVRFFYQFRHRLAPGECIRLKRKHFFQGLTLFGANTRTRYGFCSPLRVNDSFFPYESPSCYPDNYEFVGTNDHIIMIPSDRKKFSCKDMDSLIEEAKDRFLKSMDRD